MRLTLDGLWQYCDDCGDCMFWKLSVNSQGHPQMAADGKSGQLVRRYIFTRLLGKPVPRGQVVSTTCGEKLCVNPAHLVAKTRSNVLRNCYATGKRHGKAEYAGRLKAMQDLGRTKLTWELVREIRAQPADKTHTELAALYGVSHKSMSRVRKGMTWREHGASVFGWRP